MDNKLLNILRLNYRNVLKEVDPKKVEKLDDAFALTYAYDALGLCEKHHKKHRSKDMHDYSEREQKEIVNHLDAYRYVKQCVIAHKPLTEEVMKDIHERLVKGIFQGGIYRNVNISIFGASHQPPDHVKVYDRMHKFFQSLNQFKGSPLERAVYAHASIAKIHPFVDANGRLAKLVLNYFLLNNNECAISIPHSKFDEYIVCLEIFKAEKKLDPLVEFFKNLLIERYENVLQQLDV